MVAFTEALTRLKEGNKRFASGIRSIETMISQTKLTDLVEGQTPFAIILGCSDSRVPAELVFDQGLGDLFVIRIAGNIVSPSQIGSVEFAAEAFGTPLVVVMGHSHCGAVSATLDQILQPSESRSPHLASIVERVKPAIDPLLETELRDNREKLIAKAVRANVRIAADHLRHGSRILEDRINRGELLIVGAEYSLETGVVDFFDNPGS